MEKFFISKKLWHVTAKMLFTRCFAPDVTPLILKRLTSRSPSSHQTHINCAEHCKLQVSEHTYLALGLNFSIAFEGCPFYTMPPESKERQRKSIFKESFYPRSILVQQWKWWRGLLIKNCILLFYPVPRMTIFQSPCIKPILSFRASIDFDPNHVPFSHCFSNPLKTDCLCILFQAWWCL